MNPSEEEVLINGASQRILEALRELPSPGHALEVLATVNANLIFNTLKKGCTPEEGLTTMLANCLRIINDNTQKGPLQ